MDKPEAIEEGLEINFIYKGRNVHTFKTTPATVFSSLSVS